MRILPRPVDTDWTDDKSARESLRSAAVFIEDNVIMPDFLSMAIDEMIMGRDAAHLTKADREAMWEKLTTPYQADGHRKF